MFKAINISALVMAALLMTGCAGVRGYAVKDTVEGDFWTGSDWRDASHAKRYSSRAAAEEFVWRHRQNEAGGYANNGPVLYPVKVVQHPVSR